MVEAGYLYPKSKSPSETKYERLRGICSGAGGNVRYIPIDNGIQQHGRAWRYMVGAVCISVYQYTDCMAVEVNGIPSVQDSTAGQHGIPMQQWIYYVRYTNTVYNRHHQSFATPGCVYRVRACACVCALYYYIIILL